MATYLAASIIKEAVQRLADSRAKPQLCDFLVLKRALVRGSTEIIKLSQNDKVFTGAIDDLMATVPTAQRGQSPLPPFINVFGTAGVVNKGFRPIKFYSNGTAVTTPRWDRKKVVVVISENPQTIRFHEDYVNALERLVLKKGVAKPRFDDLALWFYRSTDLDTLGLTESPPTLTSLLTRAVTDLGLAAKDVQMIFDVPDGWTHPIADAAEPEAPSPGEVEPESAI